MHVCLVYLLTWVVDFDGIHASRKVNIAVIHGILSLSLYICIKTEYEYVWVIYIYIYIDMYWYAMSGTLNNLFQTDGNPLISNHFPFVKIWGSHQSIWKRCHLYRRWQVSLEKMTNMPFPTWWWNPWVLKIRKDHQLFTNPVDYMASYTFIPWTPKPWKMKVLHPKIWVITPKNEGFGFPWMVLFLAKIFHQPQKSPENFGDFMDFPYTNHHLRRPRKHLGVAFVASPLGPPWWGELRFSKEKGWHTKKRPYMCQGQKSLYGSFQK